MKNPSFNAIVRVAVPSPLRRMFDYLSADLPGLQPGVRVRVPFGRKHVIGVVLSIVRNTEVPLHKLKTIEEVLDAEPFFSSALFEVIVWAADYYQHPVGEVFHKALPALLRKGQCASIQEQMAWQLTEAGAEIPPENMRRSPKQSKILRLMREHRQRNPIDVGLSNSELALLGILPRDLMLLKKKKWVKEIKSFGNNEIISKSSIRPALNSEQDLAVETIFVARDRFECFLLEGVTGSGKTEVYLSALEKILSQGGQALILVPEIGLTPQTIRRVSERFHGRVGLLHSGLSDRDRLNTALLAKSGNISLVIGTRSAIFTPFANLRCIIVDESHDLSFKQWEGFRYHARDVAIRLAQLLNIPIVLGSATPSLSSLYNVMNGKFSLLSLKERATGAKLPTVHLIDLRQQTVDEGFANSVLRTMRREVEEGNQVFVFLNRRGFAPVLFCHACAWIATCERCQTPFTKHASPANLQCHHCGKQQRIPKHCPECNSAQLLDVGIGTERIEQVLQQKFPGYNISRIDRDSTRGKGLLESKLQEIHSGHSQILIGTQMLAKGHHFPHVTLVVMLDTDAGLYSADYAATEGMAQLMLQVSGRAGREEKSGTVLIQTHYPDHPVWQHLIHRGYRAFAEDTLRERRAANLPPFCHFALMRADAVAHDRCERFLIEAKKILLEKIGQKSVVTVYSPMMAPIEKRLGVYRWQLLISSPKRKILHENLKHALIEIERLKTARKVRWSIDIDPVDVL